MGNLSGKRLPKFRGLASVATVFLPDRVKNTVATFKTAIFNLSDAPKP